MSDKDTYILDYSKWRSGGDHGPNPTGEGATSMLNEEGYMCCLGQFALQRGVAAIDLVGAFTPAGVRNQYDTNFVDGGMIECVVYGNTNLADVLMYINDDPTCGAVTRLNRLSERMEEAGLTLRVINLPPHIQHEEDTNGYIECEG